MKKTMESLIRSFADADPERVARQLELVDPTEAAKILVSLSVSSAARILDRLNAAAAAQMLENMDAPRAAGLLGSAPLRVASGVLQQMDAEKREAILAALPEKQAAVLRDQMRYAPETAGAMMNPQVTTIGIDLTVQEVISVLRKAPRETLYYLYVVDRDGRLAGVLGTRDLLLAGPHDPVEPMVKRQVLSVPPSLDREKVAQVMDERGFLALPVADTEGRLLGVVTGEQAMEAVQQEAFEDLQRMVGAGGDERALMPVASVVKKRLPWLTLNLGTALLAALVVGLFEGTIAQLTAVAVLMPIVSAVSGNTGMQALSVVMRGLALRELAPGSARRVVFKEVMAALCNGVSVGVLCAVVAGIWFRLPGLALVIGAAMILNMCAAGLFGAAIPLLLRALGRDPAQSSSIFLTTMTDVVGFGSFLGLATLLLPMIR